jgi:DNA-binding NtrC family response regulator
VLLLGETGTGKEHAARVLHRLSGRPGAFVAVSCAELSGELMASQLFGHARGAFTGASEARPGLFRSAAGGTLLLDEIGELPAALQPKLLRVLQEGEVLPVGETRAVTVDVRVVAATHAPLEALIERGGFRRDLYARLAFWTIALPPLRARRADIIMWLQRLHAGFAARRALPPAPLPLSADAAEALLVAAWPENLRGLDRLAHHLGGRAEAAPIGVAELGALEPAAAPARRAAVARPAPPTRAELAELMERLGSVRAVARHLGRDRRQIYRWLDAFGLREP